MRPPARPLPARRADPRRIGGFSRKACGADSAVTAIPRRVPASRGARLLRVSWRDPPDPPGRLRRRRGATSPAHASLCTSPLHSASRFRGWPRPRRADRRGPESRRHSTRCPLRLRTGRLCPFLQRRHAVPIRWAGSVPDRGRQRLVWRRRPPEPASRRPLQLSGAIGGGAAAAARSSASASSRCVLASRTGRSKRPCSATRRTQIYRVTAALFCLKRKWQRPVKSSLNPLRRHVQADFGTVFPLRLAISLLSPPSAAGTTRRRRGGLLILKAGPTADCAPGSAGRAGRQSRPIRLRGSLAPDRAGFPSSPLLPLQRRHWTRPIPAAGSAFSGGRGLAAAPVGRRNRRGRRRTGCPRAGGVSRRRGKHGSCPLFSSQKGKARRRVPPGLRWGSGGNLG